MKKIMMLSAAVLCAQNAMACGFNPRFMCGDDWRKVVRPAPKVDVDPTQGTPAFTPAPEAAD